jgi:beta propeller domain-containing protein
MAESEGAPMSRRLVWIALTVACGNGLPRPASIQRNVSLHPVTGCPAVEAALQDAAVIEMRARLESTIQSRHRYGTVVFAGGSETPSASPGPSAYTTTNVQVAGVDEADIVKNDGTRIFALSGDSLHAVSSWPPAALAATGSVPIEGWPTGFFLVGDRIAVISAVPPANDPTAGVGICPVGLAASFMCGYFGPVTAKLTLIDATTLAVNNEVWLPGYPAHTRRIGSQVHLVLSDPARWPQEVRWGPSGDVWNDEQKFTVAVRALEDANESVIRSTPLSSWLPPSQRRLQGGAVVEAPYDCAQFQVGNAPVRLGFLTVATLDIEHPETPPSRTTILGEVGIIHASQDALVLASPHYWWWDSDGNADWTYVHRFDLTEGAPRYAASGGFEGHPVNAFSLDMKDGYLRAAVNTLQTHTGDENVFRFERSSFARVLDPDLRQVGSVELARGEWVTGSRFIGDRGFVVTFRATDPLFALDLGDPANPRKAGVLELPGFSTYLQAIDDAHLLAIGIDLPPDAANWQDRSLQLSIFDVSVLTAPKRTVQHRIGSAYSFSEALWEHHAFNWFPEKRLLAVPFFDWTPGTSGNAYWGSFVSDLRVFEVQAAAISPRGALSMQDLYVTSGNGEWTWSWSPGIRRSVMAADADGNTFVYAISDAGIRVAALSSLGTPLATAKFPRH